MTENGPEIFPGPDDSDQLLDALARVLASETFAEVFRLKKFLEYSVKATMAGRGDRLKGFVIACEVFEFEKEDPSDAQTTTVVRVEAGRLRRRLKDYYETEGKNDPIRISMPKGGYSTTFTTAGKSSVAGSMPEPAATRKPIHQNPVVYIAALTLLVLLYFQPWRQGPDTPGAVVNLPDAHPIIAVMPFENLTGEDLGNSFASGLTEDIVIDLGSLSALDVISTSSVLQYKGLDLSPREVGHQLGVGYILEGSVRRLPPNLRVTARLSDTATGLQLWAERFDSQAGDELALQEELARKVVSSLSISLPAAATVRFGQRYTQNKPAWFLFKQAMNLANPPSDPARLELALHAFDQVSIMDPGFAGGFAGSAYIKSFMVFFGHSQEPDADRKAAMELAARARKIDASFGLTYSAMAFIQLSQHEFAEALAMSSRAIEILIGLLNYLAGYYDEALKALLRNQERGGPIGPGQMQFLAATYSKLGDFAMAESTLIIADGPKSGISRSEKWLMKAFRDPAIPRKLLDEIEAIRTRAGLQH